MRKGSVGNGVARQREVKYIMAKSKKKVDLITNSEVEELKRKINKPGETLAELNKLSEKYNGMLDPHDVVSEASKNTSRLHHLFEWDDTVAGTKYRLMQARVLLTTVKVVYQGKQQEAFYNARVQIAGNGKVRGYFPIDRVLSDKQIHDEVLREAVRELEFAERKYQTISELKGVINKSKLKKVKATISK